MQLPWKGGNSEILHKKLKDGTIEKINRVLVVLGYKEQDRVDDRSDRGVCREDR